jgi:hypothetical protein
LYDYYKILEIPRNASLEDIKRAYRYKAKLVHPDVNDSAKAHEVFVVVNEAYETLIDSQRRYIHDMKLNYTDAVKTNAEKKKQYYGSSVKNNSYTNTNANSNSSNFHYDWNSFNKRAYKEKTDEDYFKQSPIIYNLLFVSGMFLGFLITIITIVSTYKNYWPAPFILISILGFILIRQGWRGIMGKETIVNIIRRMFSK